MKAKTIKRILNQRHREFVESIEDEDVRKLVRKNSIITGGAIVSMLLNEPVNDFDYYFTDKETTKKVAEYFVSKFKEINGSLNVEVVDEDGRIKIFVQSTGVAGEAPEHEDDEELLVTSESIQDEEEQDFRPLFLTTNAITLSNKIQLVTRFYGEPEEIHDNYDF